MQIVSVLPIDKVAPHRELSYWSAKDQQEGNIVSITVRGKAGHALVMKSEALADARQTVKESGFSLQKISGDGRRVLSQQFLRAAFSIGEWHATSAGAVLSYLVPQTILDSLAKVPEVQFRAKEQSEKPLETIFAVGSRDERLQKYKLQTRETLAHKKSFLILTPTVVEAERLAKEIDATVFHSELPKKKMLATWTLIAQSDRPLVIVGTPLALSLPRSDFGAIALERAHARGYVREERPHLNIRVCAEALARAHSAKFIAGDAALPLEHPSVRTAELPVSVIDMKPPKDAPKKAFSFFSPEALALVEKTTAPGGNVLLLTARHGLATQTVCDDCGQTFACPMCGSAMVLWDSPRGRVFKCSYCGAQESATTKCRNCNSWRLRLLGAGLEAVAAEAAKLFATPMFVMDEKTAMAHKKASVLAAEFERSRGAIMLGTEGALPYLSKPVAACVVISIDSFLFIPEYSAHERAYALLADLRTFVTRRLLIQTRMPEYVAFKALEKSEKEFAQEELALRKKFHYPPYATVIKLSVEGIAARAAAEKEKLLKALAIHKPQELSGRASRKGHARFNLLMRLPEWPDRKLVAFIRALPPNIEVRVNPRSLLSD